MDATGNFAFGVVILAAGKSSRMGLPKLLLRWGESTVLRHLLHLWERLGAGQVAVVVSPNDSSILMELNRHLFSVQDRIVNARPERGMFSSIQSAARWPGWRAELTHWAITLGDQPHVREVTLRMLLDFAATQREKICQPLRSGHRRHPVILPRRAFERLRDSAVHDLKEFLLARPGELAGFESDDAGLDLDLDTPEDYQRSLQLNPPA
jgi:molybdenum cofactor cytidylyltransferase